MGERQRLLAGNALIGQDICISNRSLAEKNQAYLINTYRVPLIKVCLVIKMKPDTLYFQTLIAFVHSRRNKINIIPNGFVHN